MRSVLSHRENIHPIQSGRYGREGRWRAPAPNFPKTEAGTRDRRSSTQAPPYRYVPKAITHSSTPRARPLTTPPANKLRGMRSPEATPYYGAAGSRTGGRFHCPRRLSNLSPAQSGGASSGGETWVRSALKPGARGRVASRLCIRTYQASLAGSLHELSVSSGLGEAQSLDAGIPGHTRAMQTIRTGVALEGANGLLRKGWPLLALARRWPGSAAQPATVVSFFRPCPFFCAPRHGRQGRRCRIRFSSHVVRSPHRRSDKRTSPKGLG